MCGDMSVSETQWKGRKDVKKEFNGIPVEITLKKIRTTLDKMSIEQGAGHRTPTVN